VKNSPQLRDFLGILLLMQLKIFLAWHQGVEGHSEAKKKQP
jgi:hypothetical protein